MSQPVIRVENLSKEYRLGTISHGTLTHDLQSWWARLRGKDDPNSLLSHQSTAMNNQEPTNPHFLALNDVSFDVQQGDLVGIIGRNGAGKSTLLKILSQVTSPSAGTVKIKGRVASLLEVGTGFHPELTGRENIFLNGAILGMSKTEIRSKFDEIVAFAELEKFIDTPVKRYSSGMYVRLAFAVAAHLEPEILIVDEVLAVGDATFQKKCLGKMKDVGKEGRTVLFVSHNMSAITALCEKALLLENGHLSCLDNVARVMQRYLESGSSVENGEVLWKGGIGDETIKLHAARILNNQNEIKTNLDVTQNLFIELDYEVSIMSESLRVGFQVLTPDATIILLSIDSDNSEFRHKVPGRYRVRAMIPRNFLNVGRYFVSIISDIPNCKICFFEENCISFIIDQTVIVGGEHGIGRKGIVRPLLIWELVDANYKI